MILGLKHLLKHTASVPHTTLLVKSELSWEFGKSFCSIILSKDLSSLLEKKLRFQGPLSPSAVVLGEWGEGFHCRAGLVGLVVQVRVTSHGKGSPGPFPCSVTYCYPTSL